MKIGYCNGCKGYHRVLYGKVKNKITGELEESDILGYVKCPYNGKMYITSIKGSDVSAPIKTFPPTENKNAFKDKMRKLGGTLICSKVELDCYIKNYDEKHIERALSDINKAIDMCYEMEGEEEE